MIAARHRRFRWRRRCRSDAGGEAETESASERKNWAETESASEGEETSGAEMESASEESNWAEGRAKGRTDLHADFRERRSDCCATNCLRKDGITG